MTRPDAIDAATTTKTATSDRLLHTRTAATATEIVTATETDPPRTVAIEIEIETVTVTAVVDRAVSARHETATAIESARTRDDESA